MDYFPLKKGWTLYYSQASTEFEGKAEIRICVESVKKRGRGKVGELRMSTTLNGHTVNVVFEVTATSKEVVASNGIAFGGRTEFKLPAKVGLKWDEEPDTHQITSTTEKVKVPAGSYAKCLKVETEIGGGDSGKGQRVYAPGVGLVYEKYDAEDLGTTVKLIKQTIEMPKEKKAAAS